MLRLATADASAARAWSACAVNSTAESRATTSPAFTEAPFSTAIETSWPLTSGSTLISVARTTPTMAAGGAAVAHDIEQRARRDQRERNRDEGGRSKVGHVPVSS